jgi:uncharacterized protein (DUF342 family)
MMSRSVVHGFKEKAVRKVNEPKSEKEPYLLAAWCYSLLKGKG